jgi:membrane-associated phospholipid phosphatase
VSAPHLAASPSRWPRWVFGNIAIASGRLARPVRGSGKPIWRAYERLAAGTAGAFIMLLLIMIFIDVDGARAARAAPRWLIDVFDVITQFGLAGWFLLPLGIALVALAFITSPSLSRMSQLVLGSLSVRLGFLFLAIALPGLVVTIVKRIIGRARPMIAGDDPFAYQFFMWRVDYASFPSGHATNAFAVAVAFGALFPGLRPLLWSYAVAVALSRVIVGAHHASDVVAGAIAGAIGALLVRDWMASRKLGFVIASDGSVVPMPRPRWSRIKRVARTLTGQ